METYPSAPISTWALNLATSNTAQPKPSPSLLSYFQQGQQAAQSLDPTSRQQAQANLQAQMFRNQQAQDRAPYELQQLQASTALAPYNALSRQVSAYAAARNAGLNVTPEQFGLSATATGSGAGGGGAPLSNPFAPLFTPAAPAPRGTAPAVQRTSSPEGDGSPPLPDATDPNALQLFPAPNTSAITPPIVGDVTNATASYGGFDPYSYYG